MRPQTRLSLICLVAILFSLSLTAQSKPRVFEIDATKLAQAKAHPSAEFLKRVRHEADAALQQTALSVTDKKQVPPSGDKRDFLSQAGYWWPNPNTPDHLPYVRRDGYRNPEVESITDEKGLNHTVHNARALALGYYITGDERYAEHAALLLRTWFLDPKTGMRPHLKYAQFVKGKNTGRGSGIVSARNMPQALDAVGMLAGSKNWTAADDAGMMRWFGEYYEWLIKSANGKHEAAAPNNHGSWYQVQLAAIELYLGKTDDARRTIAYVHENLIPSQIDSKGVQKYEMARTKSFSYSAMNLEALTTLATIAQPLGIDLYKPHKPGQPGILTAIDALMPYDNQHNWPHEQVVANLEDKICPALFSAAAYTHEAKYEDAIKRFECKWRAEAYVGMGE